MKSAKGPLRVAIFARYSSKMQDDMSLEAQITEMEAFCQKNSWEIVDRYLLPEVRSADLDRTPEYIRMLDDAKAKPKKWEMLLCHKLDRLGREREAVVLMKATLRRRGVEIRSVVENLSDSMQDRMLEGMVELFADYYARNLGQETKKGHRQLTRQGYWKGGPPAFGLTTEEVQIEGGRTRKKLTAHPLQGPIMADVFRRTAAGESPKLIRRWVANSLGEEMWTGAAFLERIKNPVYYGLIEYGVTSMPSGRPRKKMDPVQVTTGRWEGLVSEELWQEANRRVTERSAALRSQGRKPKEPYLLTMLMKCSDCGGSIVGGRSGNERRYRCSNRLCGNTTVGALALERVILGGVCEWLKELDESELLAEYRKQLEPLRAQAETREGELRRELAEIGLRRARLLDAIEQGIADLQTVQGRLHRLKEQESDLADELARLQAEASSQIDAEVELFRDFWQGLDQVERLDARQIEEVGIVLRKLFVVQASLARQEFRIVPR